MSFDAEQEIKNLGKAQAVKIKPVELAEPKENVIEATFSGLAYTAGDGGLNTKPFEVTVKIPSHLTIREDITPIGVFKQFFAKKVLRSHGGFSGVRNVDMVLVRGALPEGIKLAQRLAWTCSYDEMVKLAERYGKGRWTVFDNETAAVKGERETKVVTELYPEVGELRDAILRCRKEAEAFDREQGKRAGSDLRARWEMERELAALNTDLDDE